MSNFVELNEAIESMATDESTKAQPIKRMFVADGAFFRQRFDRRRAG